MKFKNIAFVLMTLLAAGCATHLSKPSKSPEPTLIKLGEFQSVEMKTVGISERFAGNAANQRALKKINEYLFRDMPMLFPGLKRIEKGEEFSSSGARTLRITPYIKEVKFIGGGARFWAGAMAGSSAILMQTTYEDSSTGKTIGDPEFYRAPGAYSGAWTMGAMDNRMLEDISRDIIDYSSHNR